MARMIAAEAEKKIRGFQLSEMEQDGPAGEIARIEWYERERFQKGHMSEEENVRYLIRGGYEDAALEGYYADEEDIEKQSKQLWLH